MRPARRSGGRLDRGLCAVLAALAAWPSMAAPAVGAPLVAAAVAAAYLGAPWLAFLAGLLGATLGAWAAAPLAVALASAALVSMPLACGARAPGSGRLLLEAGLAASWPAALVAAALLAPSGGEPGWLYTPPGSSVAALAAAWMAGVALWSLHAPPGRRVDVARAAAGPLLRLASMLRRRPLAPAMLLVYGLTLAMAAARPGLLASVIAGAAAQAYAYRRGLKGDDAGLLVYTAAYAATLVVAGLWDDATGALRELAVIIGGP